MNYADAKPSDKEYCIKEEGILYDEQRDIIRDGFCEIVDSFIEEAEAALAGGARYDFVLHVAENPVIQLLSEWSGYQPFWFARLYEEGQYCYYDLDKVRKVKEEVLSKHF